MVRTRINSLTFRIPLNKRLQLSQSHVFGNMAITVAFEEAFHKFLACANFRYQSQQRKKARAARCVLIVQEEHLDAHGLKLRDLTAAGRTCVSPLAGKQCCGCLSLGDLGLQLPLGPIFRCLHFHGVDGLHRVHLTLVLEVVEHELSIEI